MDKTIILTDAEIDLVLDALEMLEINDEDDDVLGERAAALTIKIQTQLSEKAP